MIPQGYSLVPFFQNTGGLVTRTSPAALSPNSASDLLNVDFDKTFGIKKRSGYAKKNSSALAQSNCVGLTEFVKADGTRYLVGVWDDKIYKMDSYDGTWDDITGAVTLTSSATNYVSFAVLNDTLIGTNGVNAPWKWTGTGNAAALSISNFTLAKYVFAYKSRLVFLATTETSLQPGRLRWSNAGTIETYSAADFLDVSTGGPVITGGALFYDDLYVSKNGHNASLIKVYYTGNEDVPFAAITAGEVGAISNQSIAVTYLEQGGSGIAYVGVDNKFRFYDGNSDRSICESITPTLETLNQAKFNVIHACYFPKRTQLWFWVVYSTNTTKSYALVYDTRLGAWLFNSGMAMNAACVIKDSDNEEQMVAGGYNGYLYTMDSGSTNDGTSFTSFYRTGWLDMGNPGVNKRFGLAQFYFADLGQNNTATIEYDYDFGMSSIPATTYTLLDSSDVFPLTFPFELAAEAVSLLTIRLYQCKPHRYIRFKISASASTNWLLYGYAVSSKNLGIKDIQK